ncbi:adenosine deaminase 2-like [Condylostylus longicornis]|uniref:adenosine deaminase 2-like n=1 Tax=Condylostylus longicornis TaxID=2530218 RepID=UPI00244D9E27|nr:adenosine deaminase 2-like [Condylostylus longicornis]
MKTTITDNLSWNKIRNSVIQTEEFLSTGGNLRLSTKEVFVDRILMKYKNDELNEGFNNLEKLAASMHFFKAKQLIDNSEVFKLLKLMPKGGLLHGHNAAMVSSEWIIKNLTYYPGLLKCTNKDGVVIFSFRKSDSHNCNTNYELVANERNRSNNPEFYDRILEKSINLYVPRPEVEYPNIKVVWDKFQNIFLTVNDFIKFLPVFKAYHYRLLEEMYQDGIFYIEMRHTFSQGYDHKNSLSAIEMTLELLNVVKDFKRTHPDFIDLRAIYQVKRRITIEELSQQISQFLTLRSYFPEFIIGIDLVGQEDTGNSLYYYYKLLQQLSPTNRFFFHAGETNWYGVAADYNILDAILLNTTRIGHGYALVKHPVLWNSVKRYGIAIEVSLISNQILHLVEDLRNHPAAFYISENIPIVITNDDPGFWNAKGLSYDFYYCLMAVGSNRAGLKLLKQLIINSLKYSAMTSNDKNIAIKIFHKRWNNFLDHIIKNYNLYNSKN